MFGIAEKSVLTVRLNCDRRLDLLPRSAVTLQEKSSENALPQYLIYSR